MAGTPKIEYVKAFVQKHKISCAVEMNSVINCRTTLLKLFSILLVLRFRVDYHHTTQHVRACTNVKSNFYHVLEKQCRIKVARCL